MALKIVRGIIDCKEGVPSFVRLMGSVELNPIGFEPYGDSDLQILMFGEQNKLEGPIEFVVIGVNQEFPDMSNFPDLKGAAQYGFNVVGIAGRRTEPDALFTLYHVQHISKIQTAGAALPPLPGFNGGSKTRGRRG